MPGCSEHFASQLKYPNNTHVTHEKGRPEIRNGLFRLKKSKLGDKLNLIIFRHTDSVEVLLNTVLAPRQARYRLRRTTSFWQFEDLDYAQSDSNCLKEIVQTLSSLQWKPPALARSEHSCLRQYSAARHLAPSLW